MKVICRNKKVIVEFEVGEYDSDLMDFLSLVELSAKSRAAEEEIYLISEEIKENWWKKNRYRFIDESNC